MNEAATPDRLAAAGSLPATLVLVGAGKMGGAMLEGWLAAGLPASGTVVIEPHPSGGLTDLAASQGFTLCRDATGIAAPDTLVLGIKPQALGEVAPGLQGLAGPGTVILSILAGKTIGDLQTAFPHADAFVRAMPNLPASIGRGATGIYASPAVTAAQRDGVQSLLAANGIVEWVEDEALIDAVTALSGSGPAYIFHLVEAMAQAGAEAGLPAGLAARLARATVTGAAALLAASPETPSTLRDNVTSKGGTTAAALEVLMSDDGLRPLMVRVVAAAKRRAGELSG